MQIVQKEMIYEGKGKKLLKQKMKILSSHNSKMI